MFKPRHVVPVRQIHCSRAPTAGSAAPARLASCRLQHHTSTAQAGGTPLQSCPRAGPSPLRDQPAATILKNQSAGPSNGGAATSIRLGNTLGAARISTQAMVKQAPVSHCWRNRATTATVLALTLTARTAKRPKAISLDGGLEAAGGWWDMAGKRAGRVSAAFSWCPF